MLTKEEILSITDKAVKEIEVPEWGGTVFVRGMTIEDTDYCKSMEDDPESLEKMIIRFVCDDQGHALFTEDDIPLMKKKSYQSFQRIVKEFREFNGLDSAEKNS
jgi:hypothetical protein